MINQLQAATNVQFGGEYTDDSVARTLQEIKRRSATKVDLIADAKDIHVKVDKERGVHIVVPVNDWMPPQAVSMREHAFSQLASIYPIGTRYARILATGDEAAQKLLTTNFDHWLGTSDKRHLVRTLDNKVRSVHSDSFNIVDNEDVFNVVFDALDETKAEVTRVDLTDDHMRIRALIKDWRFKVANQDEDVQRQRRIFQTQLASFQKREDGTIPYFDGQGDKSFEDWVIPGLEIRNSETGRGRWEIRHFCLREICVNGTTMDVITSGIHRGERLSFEGFLSTDTIKARQQALFGEIRDQVRAAINYNAVRDHIAKINEAASTPVENPVRTVEALTAKYNISEERKQQIMNRFATGGDPSRWGLVNAVTSIAHDTTDLDEKSRLEEIGGEQLLVRVRR